MPLLMELENLFLSGFYKDASASGAGAGRF
jgi:hypothetical protein